jgi:hypothetical protein
MKNERAKKIEQAIRLIWESLESHLYYTHAKSSEGIRFHKRCVRDYAALIKILSELY